MPNSRPPDGVPLGSRVRDTLTGFTGIAVCRVIWLHGCTRIGIEATELRDGKPIDTQHFDEQRVEIIEVLAPTVSPASTAITGGPMRDPVRSSGRA